MKRLEFAYGEKQRIERKRNLEILGNEMIGLMGIFGLTRIYRYKQGERSDPKSEKDKSNESFDISLADEVTHTHYFLLYFANLENWGNDDLMQISDYLEVMNLPFIWNRDKPRTLGDYSISEIFTVRKNIGKLNEDQKHWNDFKNLALGEIDLNSKENKNAMIAKILSCLSKALFILSKNEEIRSKMLNENKDDFTLMIREMMFLVLKLKAEKPELYKMCRFVYLNLLNHKILNKLNFPEYESREFAEIYLQKLNERKTIFESISENEIKRVGNWSELDRGFFWYRMKRKRFWDNNEVPKSEHKDTDGDHYAMMIRWGKKYLSEFNKLRVKQGLAEVSLLEFLACLYSHDGAEAITSDISYVNEEERKSKEGEEEIAEHQIIEHHLPRRNNFPKLLETGIEEYRKSKSEVKQAYAEIEKLKEELTQLQDENGFNDKSKNYTPEIKEKENAKRKVKIEEVKKKIRKLEIVGLRLGVFIKALDCHEADMQVYNPATRLKLQNKKNIWAPLNKKRESNLPFFFAIGSLNLENDKLVNSATKEGFLL
jgi:5'-deoxynucleotidase YfbR-like HD superfamily hydrolase